MLRKIVVLVVLIGLFFSTVLHVYADADSASANDIKIMVDGNMISMDVMPITTPEGRILGPARHIVEALGATVEWDGKITVTITKNMESGKNRIIILTVGKSEAIVDGALKTFDTKSVVMIEKYGIAYAEQSVELAENFMNIIHNVDYMTSNEMDFRNNLSQYVHPDDEFNIDYWFDKVKGNKISSSRSFVSDLSLVYVDSRACIRIRGTLKIVIDNCTDTIKAYGKEFKLGACIEQDVEVVIYRVLPKVFSFNVGDVVWLGSARYTVCPR